MRVINRTAITIVGAQPYIKWTLQKEADFNKGTLTVARAKTYGSAFLLPEFELEEDLQEWVEENATWIFELQLAAWTDDEARGPPRATSRPFANGSASTSITSSSTSPTMTSKAWSSNAHSHGLFQIQARVRFRRAHTAS
jgi:hypothetical protein